MPETFEALLMTEPDVGGAVQPVVLPFPPGQHDPPDELESPTTEYSGRWFRTSPAHERPARYVRVD